MPKMAHFKNRYRLLDKPAEKPPDSQLLAKTGASLYARPILVASIKFALLVTRSANPYANYALVANLAGVQNALRVKRLFNA